MLHVCIYRRNQRSYEIIYRKSISGAFRKKGHLNVCVGVFPTLKSLMLIGH